MPILVVIGWYNWPGADRSDLFGGAALTWIAWIGGVLVALLAIAGFVAHRRQVRDLHRMNEVARALDGELKSKLSGGWGRYTTIHFVNYRRGGRTVTVYPTSGATAVNLDVAGAKAVPFSLTFHEGAPKVTEYEPGPSRSQEFLDASVRTSLEQMERIGKGRYRAVTIIVPPDSVMITRYGRITPRETLLFLNLCWPVFDRALAECFGQTIAPPGKTCATCGGECCATCDTVHAQACGCNENWVSV